MAAEAGTGHEIEGGADGISEAANGRDGLHRRAGRLLDRVRGALPVRDGVRADEKDASSHLSRPGEKAPDLEDAEALGRGVVRSASIRDLPEADREELDDLPGEAGLELGLLEPSLQAGEWIVEVAKLTQVGPSGEAEEPGGGEDTPEGEAFGGIVERSTELAVDRRAEGVGSVGGVLRVS